MNSEFQNLASSATAVANAIIDIRTRIAVLESASRPPADAGNGDAATGVFTHRMRKDTGRRFKQMNANRTVWLGTDGETYNRLAGGLGGNTDFDLIPITPSPPPAAEQDDVVRRADVESAIKTWLQGNDCHGPTLDYVVSQIPSAPSREQIVAEKFDLIYDALKAVAIYAQDERPLGNEYDLARHPNAAPFDWRRRSMKQESIARDALAAVRAIKEPTT